MEAKGGEDKRRVILDKERNDEEEINLLNIGKGWKWLEGIVDGKTCFGVES